MSEKKYKNAWSPIKLNALKFALQEALKKAEEDVKMKEEIKTLLKKTLDSFNS